jgi:predicted CXXCH cytochrome family protein
MNRPSSAPRRLTFSQKLRSRRIRFLWIFAGGVVLAAVMISCSTTQTIMAPPSIPGASFVGNNACTDCHAEIVRDFRTADHARLMAKGKNAANASGCEGCHGPGSLHVQSGGAANTIINPRKDPEACFQCHLETRAQFNLPNHHPVPEGKMSCADCHNPHKGSIIKGGGATNVMGRNETCFQCHTEQRGPFVFEHEALREGCTSCHIPHGSVNPKMLTERNQTLCLKCHFQQQSANGAIYIGEVNHSSFLTRGTCWSAGCHEAVHGSQVSNLLRF